MYFINDSSRKGQTVRTKWLEMKAYFVDIFPSLSSIQCTDMPGDFS